MVPPEGIEPSLPKELDFESSASTSSATEARYLTRTEPDKAKTNKCQNIWYYILLLLICFKSCQILFNIR